MHSNFFWVTAVLKFTLEFFQVAGIDDNRRDDTRDVEDVASPNIDVQRLPPASLVVQTTSLVCVKVDYSIRIIYS